MIRDVAEQDRNVFLSMMKQFYSSDAVAHPVNARNFRKTFDALMRKSPFMRAFVIEDEGEPAGYALLSFTYSNEAGGMIVWIEELYIEKTHRGKGFARGFFAFLWREYPLAKRFRLEVREDNQRAMALYRKLGYGILGYAQMVKDRP